MLALFGVYSAFWFIAAGRIQEGVAAWAEASRPQKLDAKWQTMRVAGYPFAFRVELSDVQLHDGALNPPVDLRVPALAANTTPWNFRAWRFAAPQGLNGTLGSPDMQVAKLGAQSATGALAVPPAGNGAGEAESITIWLRLRGASAEAAAQPADRVAAETADLWLSWPGQPPRDRNDRNLAVAADLHSVTVPAAPAPFASKVDEIAFRVTVMGAIPAAPPRQAADSWRRAGGTVELDHFNLAWGGLRVAGAGTLALDAELQPVGGFSGAIEGYEQLMSALVAAGRLRASDARLARVALAMLAKAGPEGRPQIETSFTIQNGEMFLGPAKLGALPRIDWK